MRDNLRMMPMSKPSKRAEFWGDLFVWCLAVCYGIAIAAVVLGVLAMAYLRWGF